MGRQVGRQVVRQVAAGRYDFRDRRDAPAGVAAPRRERTDGGQTAEGRRKDSGRRAEESDGAKAILVDEVRARGIQHRRSRARRRGEWVGVRNFQARNLLRDEVKVGDGVLYASNAEPSGVTGIAEVARAGYPDPFAFRRGHKYYDPKSDPKNPTWYAVDLRFVEKLPEIVPLATLKATPGLADMRVVQKGSRLSVQPVTAREFETVRRLGRRRRRHGRQGQGQA